MRSRPVGLVGGVAYGGARRTELLGGRDDARATAGPPAGGQRVGTLPVRWQLPRSCLGTAVTEHGIQRVRDTERPAGVARPGRRRRRRKALQSRAVHGVGNENSPAPVIGAGPCANPAFAGLICSGGRI